jgi:L-asparaginase II
MRVECTPMNNSERPALKDAPTLVEIFRGHDAAGEPITECVHKGLISIVTGEGEIIYSQGNGQTLTHMRSTAKPFQVLPLLNLGFFDDESLKKNNLRLSDLALMMSSHGGQSFHTTRVEQLLLDLGLDSSALRCGIHPPEDNETKKFLFKNQKDATVFHNNCSGKHVAMLKVCLALGYDIGDYENPKHPLQEAIKKLIATIMDVSEDEIVVGIDGCSLPTYAVPLNAIARAYARLAFWQNQIPDDLPVWLLKAFQKIWQAATKFPEYLSGTNRFDTALIEASAPLIFSKTGADGVHALSVFPCERYKSGLGIAIKIIDGDARQNIRPLIVKHLLQAKGLWPHDPKLDRFMPAFKNYRNIVTGGVSLYL